MTERFKTSFVLESFMDVDVPNMPEVIEMFAQMIAKKLDSKSDQLLAMSSEFKYITVKVEHVGSDVKVEIRTAKQEEKKD